MYTYNTLTFSEILPTVCSKYSEYPALQYFNEAPITYKELEQNVYSVMNFIEKLDVLPGEKAIVLAQNSPNWGITYLALQCMGIIVVPVLPDFSPRELENVLNHSEASVIFVSENLEFKLKGISKQYISSIIGIENFTVIYGDSNILFEEQSLPTKKYFPQEDDFSILIYTSGTTDNSKGVMLSQKNVIINAFQAAGIQPIGEFERFLSVLPLSHTYENTLGLILPLLNGASVTYLRKPPTSNVLLPALQKVKPHYILTVPLIIEKVYKTSVLPKIKAKFLTRMLYSFRPTQILLHKIAGKKLYENFGGNLKFFGIGGAKLDSKVERFLRDAKFPYAIGYGLTETSPMLAGSNPTQTKFQAIGPVVKSCEIKIHNINPQTGEGEVWAKGPNIMLGYYKNEALTREVITEDGWFKTGDLAVFDSKGWLSHKGRSKNMIVGANGENIYPEEIETLINGFKHVLESIVLEQKGKLVALVHFNREELELKLQEMKSDFSHKIDDKIAELTKELQDYINSRVSKFSRIQTCIVHNDPFQKTATQKIKRYLYV